MPVERYLYLRETGNEKLAGGKKAKVLQWSFPRGTPPEGGTCIGASTACQEYCYAKRIFNQYGCTANYTYEMLDYYFETGEIAPVKPSQASKIDFMRFNVSGDIFNPQYAAAILRFVDDYYDFPMLAYTRAWNRKDIQPLLLELASRPNFHLWLSCDPATGLPPPELSEKIPTGYMTVRDNQFSDPHGQVRLVFRASHKNPTTTTKYRYANPKKDHQGIPICPPQMGKPEYERLTCLECRYCFDEAQYMKKAATYHGYGKGSAGKYPKSLPAFNWLETTEV